MNIRMLLTAFVTTSLFSTSFAYSNDPIINVTNKILIKASFQKINVSSNVEVVLLQDAGVSSISITGNEKLVPYVNVNIGEGILSITCKKNLTNKHIKIYIPVTELKSLTLASGASASTSGLLKVDDLKVLVHDGSKVVLNVIGNFEILPADDSDLIYEKYEKSKVVYLPQ